MIINKTYRFRLEPNVAQRILFARFAGSCRYVFNWGLSERKKAFEENGESRSFAQLCAELTQKKKDETTLWLSEVHSQVLQQALKDLDAAYQHFFRRVKKGETPGFPRFKKKGQKDSFRFPQGIKLEGKKIFLPKIGWVNFRKSRDIEGQILQATVKRDGEHWFICLSCEAEIPDREARPVNDLVGIDVGLKSFAVTSEGEEIDNPKFLKKALSKLRKEQRSLSRKVKGSNNWLKQKLKVSKAHRKVREQRKDFLHKLSTRLVKNHDGIAVEDLHIKGLVRNRHLSQAIMDAGWGMFVAMLRYKAYWHGKPFVQIGRFEASTKTCSACREKKPMPLSLRQYACGNCGLVMDRDHNAAINIRVAGRAILNACGGI